VILVDTAGQRELGDSLEEPASQASVELRGQARARAAREAADLVLSLEPLDPLEPVPSATSHGSEDRTISIRTFADRAAPDARPARSVSALLEPLRAREIVAAAFRERLRIPEDPWSPGTPVPFTEELALASGLRHVRNRPLRAITPSCGGSRRAAVSAPCGRSPYDTLRLACRVPPSRLDRRPVDLEIREIFGWPRFLGSPGFGQPVPRRICASLFQASTRTRLSFESTMRGWGGFDRGRHAR
jgi:hypothetical protein